MHTRPNGDESKVATPERVWLAKLARIRPGDVLLTRNIFARSPADRAQSLAIRNATGGNYSHVMMCTGIPTFIEAVGDGVSNISIQTCFAYDSGNVRVMRYRDPEVAKAASDAALMFLGRPYSVQRAIASILPAFSAGATGGHATFCSALVAAVYAAAKSKDFVGRNPMKVTPKTFEEIGAFDDITNDIFISVLTPPNLGEMSALDGDRASNPIREYQASLLAEHFYGVFGECQALKKDFPEFLNELPESFFELIQFLAIGLSHKQHLGQAGDPSLVAMIARLEMIDREAHRRFADGRFEAMLSETIRIDAESSMNLIKRSFAYDPDIDVEDIKGMAEATDSQIEARSSLPKSYESYPSGLCLTLDKWLALNQKAIENMVQRKMLLAEVLTRLGASH
ncbi:hypothetical protein [Azonexus hydrophilus]|uniref:Uncharacterized protein n=1 Tax=Azonexus hydrophilus TaxID=418702 RepID=A0ABZ2XPC3_9RHOO